MRYFASNDNIEYSTDKVSLLCEVGCDFQINHQDEKFSVALAEYMRTLPNNEKFMVELGESFVALVRKYMSEFSQHETT